MLMDPRLIGLGGALWINLANTIVLREHRRVDMLEHPDDAIRWLASSGLLPGEWPDTGDGEALRVMLVRLRSLCLDAIADLKRDGRLSDLTFAGWKKESRELSLRARLDRQDGVPRLIIEGTSLEDRVGYEVLRSLTDTLAQYPTDRIRKCEHPSCLLHFVDTSKSGRRRWCSMELCGNRAKAADFYARRKERLGGR
jgi:predicted RNA-binding Zn ribbon-like protein